MAGYDRAAAVAYAHRWAFDRNPKYGAFDELGGDCANFVSQCLYAGCGVMNTARDGWYFRSMRDRSPAWTGVYFLYRFLTTNAGRGPYGALCEADAARAGDVFQLSFMEGLFTHSGVIVDAGRGTPGTILIAAHTIDSDNRPLNSYAYEAVRFIHIQGSRG